MSLRPVHMSTYLKKCFPISVCYKKACILRSKTTSFGPLVLIQWPLTYLKWPFLWLYVYAPLNSSIWHSLTNHKSTKLNVRQLLVFDRLLFQIQHSADNNGFAKITPLNPENVRICIFCCNVPSIRWTNPEFRFRVGLYLHLWYTSPVSSSTSSGYHSSAICCQCWY